MQNHSNDPTLPRDFPFQQLKGLTSTSPMVDLLFYAGVINTMVMCMMKGDEPEKAEDLEAILRQHLLRIAAKDAETPEEAALKTVFFGRSMTDRGIRLTLSGEVMVAAALAFEERRFGACAQDRLDRALDELGRLRDPVEGGNVSNEQVPGRLANVGPETLTRSVMRNDDVPIWAIRQLAFRVIARGTIVRPATALSLSISALVGEARRIERVIDHHAAADALAETREPLQELNELCLAIAGHAVETQAEAAERVSYLAGYRRLLGRRRNNLTAMFDAVVDADCDNWGLSLVDDVRQAPQGAAP